MVCAIQAVFAILFLCCGGEEVCSRGSGCSSCLQVFWRPGSAHLKHALYIYSLTWPFMPPPSRIKLAASGWAQIRQGTSGVVLTARMPPSKRPRLSLAAAARGSLDIREALARGSVSPPSRLALDTLTPVQEEGLALWPRADIDGAVGAWTAMDHTTSPLLFEANARLIPDGVGQAFSLQLILEHNAMAHVKTVLGLAVAWWDAQLSRIQDFDCGDSTHAQSGES